MVEVTGKRETARVAVARATLTMKPATLRAIRLGNAPKGDVLGVARVAGILAAKRTPHLIPLCHPLRITGVEMEALTAVSVAALTVYDMVKAVERGVTIANVQLVEKAGGKSGHWKRT